MLYRKNGSRENESVKNNNVSGDKPVVVKRERRHKKVIKLILTSQFARHPR